MPSRQFSSWSLSPIDDTMSLPQLQLPPSPSESISTTASDTPPVHVVCNAPLVAPIPLPYHSPNFLQFELPDIDQDLSHPPYTRRTSKRKSDEVISNDHTPPKKRFAHQSFMPHSHRHTSNNLNYPLRHHTMHGKRSRVHTHT